MDFKEITAKYDNLIAEQKQTLKTMDKLTALATKLLFELQIRNGGQANANGQII